MGPDNAHRFRIGVGHWPDGWNVVVEIDGKREVYDPAYATEAEALEAADRASVALRGVLDRHGVAS